MGQWLQRLRINAKYGALNDATIQGYLRAASQLEDVWQQIDEKVDALQLQGLPAWEAYASMGYALAAVRACRLNVIFVQELLKAETLTDATNAGRLPRVTYEQALVLCEHFEPLLEEAMRAATNLRAFVPPASFPLRLGPHIGDRYQAIPLSHLQGTIAAAREMRDWTAGLLAKYELALSSTEMPVPAEITGHREKMKGELEMADFHLRTGLDMAGQVSSGSAPEELRTKAEGFLWEAMENFYEISQRIALPEHARRVGAHHLPAPEQPRSQPVVSEIRSSPPVLSQPSRQPAPAPPEPDLSAMLNTVIAERGAAQEMSSQPAPDVPTLLSQGTASTPTGRTTTAQPASDTEGLLASGAGTPAPKRQTPPVPALDTSGLLGQGEMQSPPKRPPIKNNRSAAREVHPRDLLSEERTQGLLSEGDEEQKKSPK